MCFALPSRRISFPTVAEQTGKANAHSGSRYIRRRLKVCDGVRSRICVCVCVSSVESFAKIKPPSFDTRTLREARASVPPTRLRTLAMGDIKTEEWATRTGRGVVGMRERRQHTQKIPPFRWQRALAGAKIVQSRMKVSMLQFCSGALPSPATYTHWQS